MLDITQDTNGTYTVVGGFIPMLLTGAVDPEEAVVIAARNLCWHILNNEGEAGLVDFIESRLRRQVQEAMSGIQ